MTYTGGFSIKTLNYVTKGNIVSLCTSLNEDPLFKDICIFEPEPITEGGIIFRYINGGTKWYKTMRFERAYLTPIGINQIDWPYVNKNVMEEWSNDNWVILDKDCQYGTFLKSSCGAPQFTIEELQTFEKHFNKFGIERCNEMPEEKMLDMDGMYREFLTNEVVS
jgi:hypothetical protein